MFYFHKSAPLARCEIYGKIGIVFIEFIYLFSVLFVFSVGFRIVSLIYENVILNL